MHKKQAKRREDMKQLFRRPFWLLGFLPAIIGTVVIYHIYHHMQPWISMLTDLFWMVIIGLISYSLTIIGVPCLIILALKKKKDIDNPPVQHKNGINKRVK